MSTRTHTRIVNGEYWCAETDEHGRPRAYYAAAWAREGPDLSRGVDGPHAVVPTGGYHFRPAWAGAVKPQKKSVEPTVSMDVGPLFPKYVGFFGSIFGPLKDGLKWTLKHLCCCGNSSYDEYERMEGARHKEYRREMLMKRPLQAPESTHEQEMLDQLDRPEVKHVPRVVVRVVCEMRMKLGLGAMDRSVSGNVALVRAEAARMMRGMNMRRVDAAAHLDLVEECFFGENTHYNATRWRQNLAECWILTRWLYAKKPSPYGFDC